MRVWILIGLTVLWLCGVWGCKRVMRRMAANEGNAEWSDVATLAGIVVVLGTAFAYVAIHIDSIER